jgi:hypothetical protein
MRVRRLLDFPYVLVRLRCDTCKRAGAYRLARLAVKYGAEILLDDLLVRLSAERVGDLFGGGFDNSQVGHVRSSKSRHRRGHPSAGSNGYAL